MSDDNEKWVDFKERILPDLEALLHFSLQLTMNGRDAVGLLREAMMEAYLSWDESLTEGNGEVLLQKILTTRFLNGFHGPTRPLAPIFGDNIDENPVESNRHFPATTTDPRWQSWPANGSDEDTHYLEAIAGLPAMFRSAMILSYLEGFSDTEIAGLADVPPRAVESSLSRGRRFIREELFSHLMGIDGFDMIAEGRRH
jgi:RNA polymerase sigma-70 factor, ECF subfamily